MAKFWIVCMFALQLNPDVNVFQRKFVNEVRRCEEMDRKLREWAQVFNPLLHSLFSPIFTTVSLLLVIPTQTQSSHSLTGFVEKEIKKANIPMVDTGENPEVPLPRDMIDLEVTYLPSL